MAYISSNLHLIANESVGLQYWSYATLDSVQTVFGTNYFSDAQSRGMQPGDAINVAVFSGYDGNGQLSGFTLLAAGAVGFVSSSGGTLVRLLDAFSSSALALGADLTGSANSTNAINAAAAATNGPVYLPAGTYLVSDILQLKANQKLVGDGPTATILSVPSSFNMSAHGVVALGNGSGLENIGISFYQDHSVTTRAGCIQYPYAIYAPNVSRWNISNVRISSAWNGLDLRGNCGGHRIDNFDFCALNIGIDLDGALDFCQWGRIESWPFGIDGGTPIETNVYFDGNTIAARIGRVDGLSSASFCTFKSSVVITANAASGVGGTFGDLSLDDTGSVLSVAAGRWRIGNLSGSGADQSVYPGNKVVITGGTTEASELDFFTTGQTNPDVYINGGTFIANVGKHSTTYPTVSSLLLASGTAEIGPIRYGVATGNPAGNRTVGIVKQTGGALRMRTPYFAGANSATGNAIEIATDNGDHFIDRPHLNGWAYSLGFSTNIGYFDFDDAGWQTATVTPQFATPGDSSFSSVSVTGGYKLRGSECLLNLNVSFNTNAYTTASGSFSLALSGGVPTAADSSTPLALGAMGLVTAASGVISAQITSSGTINFPIWTSNAGLSTITVTNVPASKTGVAFRVSGTYRIR